MAAPADPKSVPDDERPPPLAVKKTGFRVRHRVRIRATHHPCRRGGAGARRCRRRAPAYRPVRAWVRVGCVHADSARVPLSSIVCLQYAGTVRMTIASVALYPVHVHVHWILHDHVPDTGTCMKILYIWWTLRLQCADGLLQGSDLPVPFNGMPLPSEFVSAHSMGEITGIDH